MIPSAPQLKNEEEIDELLHIRPVLTLLEEQRLNQVIPIGDYHMPIHSPSNPVPGAEHSSLNTDRIVVLGLNESTEDQHSSLVSPLTNDSRNPSEMTLNDLQQSINSSGKKKDKVQSSVSSIHKIPFLQHRRQRIEILLVGSLA